MLRYINLTNQICDDTFEFAWYDTVCDRFLEFYGSVTWVSWEEFEKDYNKNPHYDKLGRFRNIYQGKEGEKCQK